MSGDGVPYLDGHCQTQGRPDLYHHLCPGGYRTQLGVEKRCSCPNHLTDEQEESAD